MSSKSRAFAAIVAVGSVLVFSAAGLAGPVPEYKLAAQFKVGGPGRWDFVTLDPRTSRLFVPRSDHANIYDAADGKLLGTVPGTADARGVAIVPALERGFITNAGNATVTVFDLKTFAAIGTVKTGDKPDAITFDPASNKVFVCCGKGESATLINPADLSTSSIELGGAPEVPAADGKGHVFVNLEDKSEVVDVDLAVGKVVARFPLTPGEAPTGLAIDAANRRLFVGCGNSKLMVLNADDGKVLADLPIGKGVDGVAFDPAMKLAFASCSDGTLTAIHESAPDKFEVAQTIATARGAKTLDLDPVTHKIYLITAQYGPAPAPTADKSRTRPPVIPDSFTLLVVEPAAH